MSRDDPILLHYSAALQLDEEGKKTSAAAEYYAACHYLLAIANGAVDPRRKEALKSQLKSWMDRLEYIQTYYLDCTPEALESSVAMPEQSKPLDTRQHGDGALLGTQRALLDPEKMTKYKRLLKAGREAAAEAKTQEEKYRWQLAFQSYMHAASVMFNALNELPDSEEKNRALMRATQYTSKAEALQSRIKTGQGSLRPPARCAPVPQAVALSSPTPCATGRRVVSAATQQHNAYDKDDLFVLGQSRKVDKKEYSMWDDSVKGYLGDRFSLTGDYCDPEGGFKLADKHKANQKWGRPRQIWPGVTPVIIHPHGVRAGPITQLACADCSFVASLAVCAGYEERFPTARIISRAIFPQDLHGNPIVNPCGKYAIKLLFNGAVRKVVIDDRLPCQVVGSQPIPIASHSHNKAELWVSLLEKAYLKVHGSSYDFPGSNSGHDLYCLSGWIPDIIRLNRNNEFNADAVWDRLLRGHKRGSALCTICTSGSDDSKMRDNGLVDGHAYAVLTIHKTKNGLRMFKMKNPWTCKRWLGKFSHMDDSSWDAALQEELRYNLAQAKEADDGVFWINFEDTVAHFERIHVSWNPYRFVQRLASHRRWVKKTDERGHLSRNPQFHLHAHCAKAEVVWLLLVRHITDFQADTPYSTLKVYNNNMRVLDAIPAAAVGTAAQANQTTTHDYDEKAVDDPDGDKEMDETDPPAEGSDTNNPPRHVKGVPRVAEECLPAKLLPASLATTPCYEDARCSRKRVHFHDNDSCVHRGIYQNTNQYLARPIHLHPGVNDLTVVVSTLQIQPISFSITAYCTQGSHIKFHPMKDNSLPYFYQHAADFPQPTAAPSDCKAVTGWLQRYAVQIQMKHSGDLILTAESAVAQRLHVDLVPANDPSGTALLTSGISLPLSKKGTFAVASSLHPDPRLARQRKDAWSAGDAVPAGDYVCLITSIQNGSSSPVVGKFVLNAETSLPGAVSIGSAVCLDAEPDFLGETDDGDCGDSAKGTSKCTKNDIKAETNSRSPSKENTVKQSSKKDKKQN
eukprot:gene12628-2308_t